MEWKLWNGMGLDGIKIMEWNGIGWNRMRWDEMEWDEMRWNGNYGMGWAGTE